MKINDYYITEYGVHRVVWSDDGFSTHKDVVEHLKEHSEQTGDILEEIGLSHVMRYASGFIQKVEGPSQLTRLAQILEDRASEIGELPGQRPDFELTIGLTLIEVAKALRKVDGG